MCANYVSYQNTHTTLMILDSQCKLCVSSSVHNLTVYLCLLRELQLCLEHDRKWKRMCSWKLFSLHFKKQKQKAVQSAGKSGELAVFVHACLCVCVWKRESETHTEKAGHLWGNASQGFLCASGFVLEGYGTLRGWDKQTAGPVVERTNSDPKSKRVKNVHTLRLNAVWWSFHVIWRAGVKPCSLLYTLPCLHHADLALRQNDSEADCQHTNGSCVLLLNSSKRQLSITPPSLM